MTIKDLCNETFANYKRAMKTGNINDITNIIRGYQVFCNLYHMGLVSEKNFNTYFTHFYNMVQLVYNKYLVENNELLEKIKRMTDFKFKTFCKIKY